MTGKKKGQPLLSWGLRGPAGNRNNAQGAQLQQLSERGLPIQLAGAVSTEIPRPTCNTQGGLHPLLGQQQQQQPRGVGDPEAEGPDPSALREAHQFGFLDAWKSVPTSAEAAHPDTESAGGAARAGAIQGMLAQLSGSQRMVQQSAPVSSPVHAALSGLFSSHTPTRTQHVAARPNGHAMPALLEATPTTASPSSMAAPPSLPATASTSSVAAPESMGRRMLLLRQQAAQSPTTTRTTGPVSPIPVHGGAPPGSPLSPPLGNTQAANSLLDMLKASGQKPATAASMPVSGTVSAWRCPVKLQLDCFPKLAWVELVDPYAPVDLRIIAPNSMTSAACNVCLSVRPVRQGAPVEHITSGLHLLHKGESQVVKVDIPLPSALGFTGRPLLGDGTHALIKQLVAEVEAKYQDATTGQKITVKAPVFVTRRVLTPLAGFMGQPQQGGMAGAQHGAVVMAPHQGGIMGGAQQQRGMHVGVMGITQQGVAVGVPHQGAVDNLPQGGTHTRTTGVAIVCRSPRGKA